MQAALSTAIDHAATAFSLTGSSNLEAVVADFIAWLAQFAPETS
jgi:hypothetical protein